MNLKVRCGFSLGTGQTRAKIMTGGKQLERQTAQFSRCHWDWSMFVISFAVADVDCHVQMLGMFGDNPRVSYKTVKSCEHLQICM